MEAVFSPVLHNIVPPVGMDKTELPQLFTTFTTGVAGIAFGEAIPEACALVHPFRVLVTVYVPVEVIVRVAVVAPVLQSMVPPVGIDRRELPQLFTTVITGVAGLVFGAAIPEPAALVQPFTVCVTLKVPPVVTTIVDAVAPVLHRRLPAAVVDKEEVPLQLFTTVTIGDTGVVFGAAEPKP